MSASPRKMSAMKAPLRKRRRINVEKGHKNDSNSYVLKLYDRSVNLAKFSPNTALYPVCRAWIKNQPNSTPTSTSIKYVLHSHAPNSHILFLYLYLSIQVVSVSN